jgi:TPP-dependent pyruvate/acetoin dehydrogenase alpha subunit
VKSWGTIRTPVLLKDYFLKQSNAAGVLQVPLVISVWDDEYGISVHAKRKPGLLV